MLRSTSCDVVRPGQCSSKTEIPSWIAPGSDDATFKTLAPRGNRVVFVELAQGTWIIGRFSQGGLKGVIVTSIHMWEWENNPPLFIEGKAGQSHVFVGAPKGGVTKALCGKRPFVFGGETIGMTALFPKFFNAPPTVGGLDLQGDLNVKAPEHWAKFHEDMSKVTCQTCKRSAEEFIRRAWESRDLLRFAPSE